jgi:hypothetical protein
VRSKPRKKFHLSPGPRRGFFMRRLVMIRSRDHLLVSIDFTSRDPNVMLMKQLKIIPIIFYSIARNDLGRRSPIPYNRKWNSRLCIKGWRLTVC